MFGLIVERLFGGFWGIYNATKKRNAFYPVLRILYAAYLRSCGSFVGLTTSFQSAPVLPHGLLGIFISGEARIGKNSVIYQGVTIGSNTTPGSKGYGAPIIGDNCFIGAGAKIIGAVTVGNNVRIGANCVVVKNLGDNCVAVGPQAMALVRDEMLDNTFYSRKNGRWVHYIDGEPTIVTNASLLEQLGP